MKTKTKKASNSGDVLDAKAGSGGGVDTKPETPQAPMKKKMANKEWVRAN